MIVKIHEIEVGPHFLTVYGLPYREFQIELAPKVYKAFLKKRPALKDIQQQDFTHRPNDPNCYHPYGEPVKFRKAFRHFHMRYGYSPSNSDVGEVIEMLVAFPHVSLHEEFKVTRLEDNRTDEHKDLSYPSMEGMTYEQYISMLRKGDWRE